jgi:hypothetical protein
LAVVRKRNSHFVHRKLVKVIEIAIGSESESTSPSILPISIPISIAIPMNRPTLSESQGSEREACRKGGFFDTVLSL